MSMSIKKDWDIIDTYEEHDVQWGKGDIATYQNFIFHNPNGPAIIYANGDKYWYLHGNLHNTNGPAVLLKNGYEEYWIDGIQISKEEFNKKLK